MANKRLTIWGIMPSVLEALRQNKNVVISSPPASGKTTQVPQALFTDLLGREGLVIVVESRRVACRMAAKRVAAELGVKMGREVGCMTRYERRISKETRILFLTDGVLIRLLEQDTHLTAAMVVVFDEFHERRMLSDLALGVLREAQKRRSRLRLVVMSATPDVARVATYLEAYIVQANTSQQTVTIRQAFHSPPMSALPFVTARAVCDVIRSGKDGDILVFLPGKSEIRRVDAELRRLLPKLMIVAMHGDLTSHEQDGVFTPSARRRVILATNIAETSVTIPGVRVVVDSGLERRGSIDPHTGAHVLTLQTISRASAEQRAARAGREGPGTCIRLWSAREHMLREETCPPEIRRSDIAHVALILKSIGVRQVKDFPFFEGPTAAQIASAEHLLWMLGAIDEGGELTHIGWQMLRLPLAPRYARMVVEAERTECLEEVARIVGLVAGRPVLRQGYGQADGEQAEAAQQDFVRDDASDFFTLLRVMDAFQAHDIDPEWSEERFLDHEALTEAERVRDRVVAAALARGSTRNRKQAKREMVLRSVCTGLPDRLAKRLSRGLYLLERGGAVANHEGSTVVDAEYVLATHVRVTQGMHGEARMFLSILTRVDLEALRQWLPHLFWRERSIVAYVPQTGLATVREVESFLSFVIDRREHLISHADAWKLQTELTEEAKEHGYRDVEVQADTSKESLVIVDGERFGIPLRDAGRYWVSYVPGLVQETLRFQGRRYPLPVTKVPLPSALERRIPSLAGLSDIIDRLGKK